MASQCQCTVPFVVKSTHPCLPLVTVSVQSLFLYSNCQWPVTFRASNSQCPVTVSGKSVSVYSLFCCQIHKSMFAFSHCQCQSLFLYSNCQWPVTFSVKSLSVYSHGQCTDINTVKSNQCTVTVTVQSRSQSIYKLRCP